MTDTTVSTANQVQRWQKKLFREYVRENEYGPYMGTDENAVIQIGEDLTKQEGDRITVSLVGALTGAGVTGNTALEGAEEALNNHGHQVTVATLRNGVLVTDNEQQKTVIQLLKEARIQLKIWAMDKLRDGVNTALHSIDGTAYGSASEASKDTWLTNNADRVLFGALLSNNSSNDHSLSLANIDNTNDQLDAGMVSLAKRMAKTATPKLRPIRVNGAEEWFVLFAQSLAFRDLKNDTTIQQANREAWTRGRNNPIFRDGDLLYDGVIIREVPSITVLSGVGAGSIDVAPNFFCGAQAVSVQWAKRTKAINDTRDYGFRKGVGIHEMRGIEKLVYDTGASSANQDHGVLTVYSAGVADS